MDYYEVIFRSFANFDQMLIGNEPQDIRLFCQKADPETGEKEIIFNLPIPENFKSEEAQFSITKPEAELLINIFKFHFGIK